ncbi:phage major capsid protein [Sphingomonas colocasiae]|uniref:Phage major capsid protein n=1 Tax=Sphingomonas colocasiae TaxID=1848973 RepID=A0ABS7PYS1_9SPHN|nr:phage major capsid protein [Sphingomonas colocasiae]MBY8826114.1 phage major capsid protein [Sphingomonas colocasiae]
MKKVATVAIIAASTALATMPRAVSAMPMAKSDDPIDLIKSIQTTFESFKEANDQALKSKVDDAVLNEKIDKINADLTTLTKALDAANVALAAAKIGGAPDGISPEAAEHSSVFNTWFRKGDRAIDADLKDLSIKAELTTQSDPDGGYVVPIEMERGIERVLGTVSAMRGMARVIRIGTSGYKKLVNVGGATSGWVGEEDARPETDTPTLREIAINTGEIYANPAATQTLLDDAMIDIAEWLAEEVSIEFAEQEGEAFILGNGNKKPRGILAYDAVANASHVWGKLGFVKTGGASGFAASDPADALIDLYYSLKKGYRNNASFLTSDAVLGTMRKWKDGEGNYLWSPPSAVAEVGSILGKPIETDDNMPGLGAGNLPVAFGDFKRGYTIVDRIGTRVLRDPYTNKPFVHFYTTKRVGGGVTNFEAIKLLKCSA